MALDTASLNSQVDSSLPDNVQTRSSGVRTLLRAIIAFFKSAIDGLATVATSGSYSDLSNTPSIPTNETIQDMIGSFLSAGSGITLSYNDAANTLTITATGGTYSDELAQDAAAALFAAGTHSGFQITYDDALNKFTVVIPAATTTAAGLLAAADKTKLDKGRTFVKTTASSVNTSYNFAMAEDDNEERLVINGNVGTVTFTSGNLIQGRTLLIRIEQGGSGSYTFALPSTVILDRALSLNTAVGSVTLIALTVQSSTRIEGSWMKLA